MNKEEIKQAVKEAIDELLSSRPNTSPLNDPQAKLRFDMPDKEIMPVIEDNEGWDEISERFEKDISLVESSAGFHVHFWSWLKSNYKPPQKR